MILYLKMKIRVLELECYFGFGVELKEVPHFSNDKPPFPDHLPDNMFWFLQITDIHVSFVNNFSISGPLQSFCKDVIGSVNPSLIIVSGDLTHAKFADERKSQQFSAEWKAYYNAVQKCSLGQIPWLDIRGNHDAFNVPAFFDSSNYFIEYSTSWKKHNSKSYRYSHQTDFGVYNFIAVDVCPDPGPKRPYNFFGVLHMEDLVGLRRLSRKRGNHTIWFSHYPSAIISTDHHELRSMMGNSIAHVCGHLHTLGDFVPKMYGKHPSGHLELELGDFTGSKRFRLLAFDHDLFSFVDTTMGIWPLILVTNPKDAKYLAPTREPIGRMLNSTHVRILVFSTAGVESVQLFINGEELPTPAAVDVGPLYVSPWQPSKYSSGLHDLTVIAADNIHRKNVYRQKFSLDGTLSPMDRLPQLLLLTDFHSLLRLLFLFTWLALVSILLITWISQSERSYFYDLLRAKGVFYPYISCVLYFGIGPWYLGEITTGVYGFVCVHGVYLMGRFIPGSITYLHGLTQICLVYIPLLYYLKFALSRNSRTCSRCFCNCVLIFCVIVQILWGLTAYPYGIIALILSPGGTWPIALTLWLIFKSSNIKNAIKLY